MFRRPVHRRTVDKETAMTAEDDRQKVWELIKDIRVGMLTTSDERGAARARPMGLANSDFDGALWFFTRDESLKTKEIENHPRVVVSFEHPGKQHYVSVTGTARVVINRQQVREMWSEMARVWFPQGPDDPELALIAVDVEEAEYWDSPSAAVVFVYGYAKARLTGEPPYLGENKSVTF
jgi:general stress protein 26